MTEPSKDSLCVLKSLAKRGTTSVDFELTLSHVGNSRRDEQVELTLVSMYARPYLVPEGESHLWELSLEAEHEDSHQEVVLINPFTKTIEQVADEWNSKMKKLFPQLLEPPTVDYWKTSGLLAVTLPPHFDMALTDNRFAAATGLIQSSEETSLTQPAVFENDRGFPQTIRGEQLPKPKVNLKYQLPAAQRRDLPDRVIIKLTPQDYSRQTATALETSGTEMTENNREALERAVSGMLEQSNLSPKLLTVKLHKKALVVKSNPRATANHNTTVYLHLDGETAAELDLDDNPLEFKYGAGKVPVEYQLKAVGRGAEDWDSPVNQDQPMMLVVDAMEATSFVTSKGFVHILGYAEPGGHIREATPIRARIKNSRFRVNFLNADLKPFSFAKTCNFFLVLKATRLAENAQ